MVGDLAGKEEEPKYTRCDLNCTVSASQMMPSWSRHMLDFLKFHYTSRNTALFDYFKCRSSIWKEHAV